MQIPEVKRQAIASGSSHERFSGNSPVILMMAPSGSISMNCAGEMGRTLEQEEVPIAYGART